MENRGVYFNGRRITHPGAYSSTDASKMVSQSVGIGKIIAMIGPCTGGEPGEILWFTNPAKAKETLKSGDLLKAMEKAWSPTELGGGAEIIGAIRANPALKSKYAVSDGTAVSASTGSATAADGNTSTGAVTSSGAYTGTTDSDFQIVIDSTGTLDKANATYKWRKDDGDWTEDVSCNTGGLMKEGVSVAFGVGNYVAGDSWTITAICSKTHRDCGEAESKDWGARSNNIHLKLETGTQTGTKKWTVRDVLSNTYEVFDNVGQMFTVIYSGTEAYCGMVIDKDTVDGKAKTLKTMKGASSPGTEDISIDLTLEMYKDITKVVDEINSHAGYVCKLIPGIIYNAFVSRELDAKTYSDLKTETLITAVRADSSKTLTNGSKFINFNITDWDAGIPANFAYAPLTGGSEGTLPNSWVSMFDKFAGINISSLVPVTGDATIHAEAKAHIIYASDSLRKERSMVCGGYSGETKQQTMDRSVLLNSDRVQLAYPGFYDYNDSGELVLYPSYITAGMYAGRQAFKEYGESCTFDYFNVVKLEKELGPDDIRDLQSAGVAPLEVVFGEGIRLVQDITTYMQDSNPLHVERSIREIADYLGKKMRSSIEKKFIGGRGVKGQVTSLKNLVIDVLEEELDKTIVAYRNVVVTYEDRVARVEYEASPVEPINFVLITNHFYIESITA